MRLDEVIKLRQDSSWRSFREFFHELVADIRDDPQVLQDPDSWRGVVKDRIGRAVFEELRHKHPSGLNLGIDLGLGALGVAGPLSLPASIVSPVKSVVQYYQGQKGWHVFLMKMEKRS